MKLYMEAIQYHVDRVESNLFRHFEFPSIVMISYVYDVPQEKVVSDINDQKQYRKEKAIRLRKEEHKRSNEARRLANIKKELKNG